jgi:magnesium/cobalt transport protein CorA
MRTGTDSMATALLFDRDRVDEVDDWTSSLPRVGRSAILWIDLEKPTDEDFAHLIDAFDLESETADDLRQDGKEPRLADHGRYLHVTAIGLSDERDAARVDCLVSKRWLVTLHDGPVEVVDRFREIAEGTGSVGMLDGLGFLANLLEWALSSYLQAFEELEHDLEDMDARAMSGTVSSTDGVLSGLVEMRREVGRLRRALVSHREVVLALTRPELEAIASSDSAERFSSLRDRLEEAVQASRDTRESIVGSFDVFLASTGQRTNEIMKVLTLASVLLLPGALIAGVMGMNFKLGIFETAAYFWVVIAGIAVIAIVTLAIARVRAWI